MSTDLNLGKRSHGVLEHNRFLPDSLSDGHVGEVLDDPALVVQDLPDVLVVEALNDEADVV